MLKGVDISNWQNVGAGDGYDFVICKATEGCGFTDKKCDQHYQRAKKNGQLRGVYHFARPDLGNTAVAEADWFLKETKGYHKDAILILDWEPSGQLGNVSWAKAWCDRVYEKTGVHPVIYMSASVVNGYDWSSVAKDCGLWIAGYPAKYNVDNPPTPECKDMPYAIGKWSFWIIWQYTSCREKLDKNISNLTKDQWAKYAGYYKETTKEEPKVEEPTSSKDEQVGGKEILVEEPTPAKKFDIKEYNEAMDKLTKGVKMPFTLPTKVYEFGRWLLWLVVPAVMLFLALLNTTLNLGWNMEAINVIVDGACVLLGTILGIAKNTNDKKE